MRRLKLDEKSAEHLETLFHFKPGDLVLRRTKVLGKLASKAEGPYVVVKIGGSFHQRVTIAPEQVQVGPKRKRNRDKRLVVHTS